MSAAKRILYIITLPDLGGAQSHVLSLIDGLKGTVDLHLATSRQGPLTDMAQTHGAVVHIIPSLGRSINPLSDVRSVRECLRLIRDLRPDLVHVHSSKAGLVGRIAAKKAGVPCVFTAHGWGFKPGVPLVRRAIVWASEAFAALLATRIICVSEYDGRLARRYLPGGAAKYITIYNGLAGQAPLAAQASGSVAILMTARFQEPKEQRLLLQAFALLDRTQAHLVFVGDGPERAICQARAQELGIAERVRFLGERSDITDLLAQAQIFALLSRYEGLPISILEAMRAGLPVVASNVGGIPEQVEHGVTGFLVPPGDARAVASALRRLIDEPQLRESMGEAGRRKFCQTFMLEDMLAQTQAVYIQALHAMPAVSVLYPPLK